MRNVQGYSSLTNSFRKYVSCRTADKRMKPLREDKSTYWYNKHWFTDLNPRCPGIKQSADLIKTY